MFSSPMWIGLLRTLSALLSISMCCISLVRGSVLSGGGGFPVGLVLDIRAKDSLMHFGFHSNLIDFWGAFQVG